MRSCFGGWPCDWPFLLSANHGVTATDMPIQAATSIDITAIIAITNSRTANTFQFRIRRIGRNRRNSTALHYSPASQAMARD